MDNQELKKLFNDGMPHSSFDQTKGIRQGSEREIDAEGVAEEEYEKYLLRKQEAFEKNGR